MANNNPNQIELLFIVSGVATPITANLNAPMKTAVHKALQDSGNVGQPLENWELKDADGKVLDLEKKIGDYGFDPGVQLFLSLLAGVAG